MFLIAIVHSSPIYSAGFAGFNSPESKRGAFRDETAAAGFFLPLLCSADHCPEATSDSSVKVGTWDTYRWGIWAPSPSFRATRVPTWKPREMSHFASPQPGAGGKFYRPNKKA
jgi:hypothetical protein